MPQRASIFENVQYKFHQYPLGQYFAKESPKP